MRGCICFLRFHGQHCFYLFFLLSGWSAAVNELIFLRFASSLSNADVLFSVLLFVLEICTGTRLFVCVGLLIVFLDVACLTN